jgi:polyribonucleotide nucleotidyltransferase
MDRSAEYPIRMLVPGEHVGALIGRSGATIRGIMQSTGARIDIYRNNGNFEHEKAVTIAGSPENTSAACKKVLETMAEEISNSKKRPFGPDVSLRLLASNSLIGRVIGKAGTNIVQIMQETGTRIHISNQPDPDHSSGHHQRGHVDGDRVITIRGSVSQNVSTHLA